MSETHSKIPNVNVTLDPDPEADFFQGKPFPCPVCGMTLEIRISCKGKPYCTCIPCGIQLFFRGKAGIERLREILESKALVSSRESSANSAITLYNRLEQLKTQRDELELKQGFIFRDPNLDLVISTVEVEIKRIESELKKLQKKTQAEKKR